VTSLHHQVVPANRALGCVDCHAPANVTCARCHKQTEAMDLKNLLEKRYPQVNRFLDYKDLVTKTIQRSQVVASTYRSGRGSPAP